MSDKRTCIVTNRFGGPVSYRVPEMAVTRLFQPGEVKKGIPFDELNAVSMQPGGRALLRNYLFIQDEAVVNEIFNTQIRKEQPEYLMSEEELIKWMPTCELDEFKDCLDYAPAGILDLIKRHAVSMPLTDLNKLNAIKEILDYDVQAAIELERQDKEDEEVKVEKKGRRVKIADEEEKEVETEVKTPVRRTAKYNVSK